MVKIIYRLSRKVDRDAWVWTFQKGWKEYKNYSVLITIMIVFFFALSTATWPISFPYFIFILIKERVKRG
jgi:hypothetical protein